MAGMDMGAGGAATGDMAVMPMNDIGGPLAPSFRAWAPADFGFMFAMWSVMMFGMMTPSVAPIVLLYAAAGRRAAEGGVLVASTIWFFAGYIAVWISFSALATLLQWGLTELALLTPMMATGTRSWEALCLLLSRSINGHP
jgi:predicted metal-binding membrane protein